MDEIANDDEIEPFTLDQKINELQSISQSEAKLVLQEAEEEVRDFLEGFSLTEEEAIAEEIDTLLNSISSKSEISVRLGEDRQLRMEEALRKCMLVFTKQKVRNFAADALSLDKSRSTSSGPTTNDTSKNVDPAPKRTGQSAADALMIQMLQKKVSTLKKNIELSDQKARTVNMQWIADKARYKEMLDKSQHFQDELRTRMQIMEKKARKLEQLDRDSNMISIQPNEVKELETVKESLANAESELSEKKQAIVGLSVELSDKKLELSTAETRIDALSRRVDELSKSEEQLHSQIEGLEKEGRTTMFRISDLQRDLSDINIELEEEKLASQRYRNRLEQQQADFDDKINGYRSKIDELRQLVERIMDEKEALFRESTLKTDAFQRENGKLIQEKEVLSRGMKNLTSSLQNIAKELLLMSTRMQQRDQDFLRRIDTNVRTSDYLKGEVTRLGTAVSDLTSASNSKVENVKRVMQDQLDVAVSNVRITTAKLDLATQQLQEMRDSVDASSEEWNKERQKLQQDFVTATMTIQAQREEIQNLKNGSSGVSKEEMDELLESQKHSFQDKMAEMRKESELLLQDLRESREKNKSFTDDNRALAKQLDNVRTANEQLIIGYERTSFEKEDYIQKYCRLMEVHHQSNDKFEKLVASMFEQYNSTLSELERVSTQLLTKNAAIVTNERVVFAKANDTSVQPIYIATSDASVQTDPMKTERDRRHDEIQVIPGEEIVYGKIEALVKESLITSNLYFSKETETFSNTYPIDENFLKDLVSSFVNMAQGIREMAKQVRAKDIELIVSAVAKDLIFKLDKARDESVTKIKAEQADVMAERIDETIQMMRRDKEAALYEHRESFERELLMAKSRTDKEMKRLEDMLSDQREMYRKELRKAREQWERELDETDDNHLALTDPSQSDLNEGTNEITVDSQTQEPQVLTEPEESKNRVTVQSGRRRRLKRNSAFSSRDFDMEIMKAQWRLDLEESIRNEIRNELESEYHARQQQQKQHILKELGLDGDEVDKQLIILWKELPEKFKGMDLAQMKNELLSGSLSHMGDVRMENFDRLRNKRFGTDDIIQLTIIEHHMRFDNGEANEDGSPFTPQQLRQYRTQLKSMEIQRNMLLQRIVQQTSVLDLLSYLHATDVHLQLLSTLNAWRSLLYYSAGGIFKDVLVVHMDVLQKCIEASGGLKVALSNLSFVSPDTPTDQWPQYFRVKALEVFRTQLLIEARDFKKSMNAALKFLQDKNTLTVLHGAKLNNLMQDAVLPNSQHATEAVIHQLRNNHTRVVGQLRKSYAAIEKFAPTTAEEVMANAAEEMAIQASQQVPEVQYPSLPVNSEVGIANQSAHSAAALATISVPTPVRTPSKAILRSDSVASKSRGPSAMRASISAAEPPLVTASNSQLSGHKEAARSGSIAVSNVVSTISNDISSIEASAIASQQLPVSESKHMELRLISNVSNSAVQDLSQSSSRSQEKIKGIEDMSGKKRTVAPDLRKLAFDSTFSYSTSSPLSDPRLSESEPSSVRIVLGVSFHPVLDQLFVSSVEGHQQKKKMFDSFQEAMKKWEKQDIVGCTNLLHLIATTDADLQEVARLLQRDAAAGSISVVADEIRQKLRGFDTVMKLFNSKKTSNLAQKVLFSHPGNVEMDTASSRCESFSNLKSIQTFDCATQTPVYKESSLVGAKTSKSRRPDRSARTEMSIPHVDRPDDSRRRGLPPGFILANFRDDEFEVAPGLFLVHQGAVEAILIQQDENLNPGKSLSELQQKIRFLPGNIFYCRGKRHSSETQDLRDAEDVLELPVVQDCFPLVFPAVFSLQQGANLVCGFKYIGQGNEYVFSHLQKGGRLDATDEIVTLPHDLLLLQIADDLPLPYGIYPVQILPRLILSDDRSGTTIDKQLSEDLIHSIPPGHEIVQLLNCVLDFPVGLEVAPGIRMAATPLDLILPENTRLVKKDANTPLPDFLAPVKFISSEEEPNPRSMLRTSCVIVEKPQDCAYGLGMELLFRPSGFAMPPNMSLVPVDEIPPNFVVPPNHDLVQLEPLIELPLGARLTAAWMFCPRPHGMQLLPHQYLVCPDATFDDHSIPPLPHFACELRMPTLPAGVSLPSRTRLIRLNIARLTPFALPEGCILAPGVTVVSPQRFAHDGHLCELRRPAVNALVVKREPGAVLPDGVIRGSRSDLPSGLLLGEFMEVVLVPVRFELPIGIRLDSNVVLGPNVQLAPGTRLQSGVTQTGNRGAPYLSVVPWPHGVCLPCGTELVKRPPEGTMLPFEFQEVHHSSLGDQLPKDTMMIRLPRKLHLPSLLEISEQLVFGVESVLDSCLRALPDGMVLVSRQSRSAQWPPELVPVPMSDLPKKFANMLERREKDAMTNMLENSSQNAARGERPKRQGVQVRMNINIEVARLQQQVDFPAGVEIIEGVITLSRPYWAMPLHNVVLVQLPEQDKDDAVRRLQIAGMFQVRLRSEMASNQSLFVSRSSQRPHSESKSIGSSTNSGGVEWSLPPNSIFIKLPETFNVFSWRNVLPNIDAVNSIDELHGLAIPPAHFLIQRPRHRLGDELPFGFQLGISGDYRGLRVLTLPPQVEIMHLIPVRYLPRGVNIINTSVLTKNSYNNLSGSMYLGLNGATYTRKLFDPRWIPRVSPFEPISNQAVVLPWPEVSCRLERSLEYYRDANMLVFVRDQMSQQMLKGSQDSSTAGSSTKHIAGKNYPSNLILQRDSDAVVNMLTSYMGDPHRDAFLLNVPTNFSQASLDRGIPVCRIELVKISDGFPGPIDRLKPPSRSAYLPAYMRNLSVVNDEATICPRITRIRRQRIIDPALEMNRFLAEACVFFFSKTEQDIMQEAEHLGFDIVERGIDRLLSSVQQLKSQGLSLEAELKNERNEGRRQLEEIENLSNQVRDLQIALQTDDDLRAIIEKLKSVVDEKEEEVKLLKRTTTDVQERLQRQVDVLTSQVATYEEEKQNTKQDHPSTQDVSLQQQIQLAQYTEIFCQALDAYAEFSSGFVRQFVNFWCEHLINQQSNFEELVVHSTQSAIERRMKLKDDAVSIKRGGSSSGLRVVEHHQHNHASMKAGGVRPASSLEDDESVNANAKSVDHHSAAGSHVLHIPTATSNELTSDLRALYKTSEMQPSQNFIQFSRSMKLRDRKQTELTQSLSALPHYQEKVPTTIQLDVKRQKFQKIPQSNNSQYSGSIFSLDDADDLSSIASFRHDDYVLGAKISMPQSHLDPSDLHQSCIDFFNTSVNAIKGRLREDPNTFLSKTEHSGNLFTFKNSQADDSLRRTKNLCGNLVEVFMKQRDMLFSHLVSALEHENQTLFFKLYNLQPRNPRSSHELVGEQDSIESLDHSVDVSHGPSVSELSHRRSQDKLTNQKLLNMQHLEQTIRKYELQIFQPHLSPVENLATQLQNGHHLQQQLKLSILILKKRQAREEQRLIQEKQRRLGFGPQEVSSDNEDLDNPDKLLKGITFRLSRLGQHISQIEERLRVAELDSKQCITSILDHVETYQRCVQDILPPRMFHIFLAKSAQYYDKLRNLAPTTFSLPGGKIPLGAIGIAGRSSMSAGSDSLQELSLHSIGSQNSDIGNPASSLQLRPLKGGSSVSRSVGGIGTMPSSNAISHLRGQSKLHQIQPVVSTFKNVAQMSASLR